MSSVGMPWSTGWKWSDDTFPFPIHLQKVWQFDAVISLLPGEMDHCILSVEERLPKRDKVNLDIFWLKDKSLEDSDDLPDPDVIAQEIADDLQTALDQFSSIANGLKE